MSQEITPQTGDELLGASKGSILGRKGAILYAYTGGKWIRASESLPIDPKDYDGSYIYFRPFKP